MSWVIVEKENKQYKITKEIYKKVFSYQGFKIVEEDNSTQTFNTLEENIDNGGAKNELPKSRNRTHKSKSKT